MNHVVRRLAVAALATLLATLGGCSDGIVSGGPGEEEADLGLPGSPEDPDRPTLPGADAGASASADQKATPDPSPTCPSEAPRDPAYWPFEASDPWNTPIGSGAAYAAETSPGFDPKAGASLNCTGWSHPVFVARSTDPVRTFYHEDGSVCAEIHVPEEAEPDGEEDAHLHVVDEKHSRVVETWGCWRDEDGDFHASACVVNQLRGPGVLSSGPGVRGGRRGGPRGRRGARGRGSALRPLRSVGLRGLDGAPQPGNASRGCRSGLVNKAANRSTCQQAACSRVRGLGRRVSVEAASPPWAVEASISGGAAPASAA
jgi:hypothetical protein